MQNAPMDWGDLKHFLAVARGGSALAASKQLGVNQTTVARRIAALEDALGERLFERASGGYRLTDVGKAVVGAAERVAAEVETFSRMVEQSSIGRRSVLRVTTNDAVADLLVTPWLDEYASKFPDLRVEMILDDRRLDLERGEADIAIRTSKIRPEGENLVIRNLGQWGMWAVYAGRSYIARAGRPESPDDLHKHTIIGAAGSLAPYEPEIWRQARADGARTHSSSSSISNIASAVRRGLGVGMLPCMVGELEPEMERCFLVEELKFQLMLITRTEIRKLPHVRAFNDFVVARAGALSHIIEGRNRPG